MSVAWNIVLLFVLILLNGFFAMSEFAVLSARRSLLRHAADKGDGRAKAALELIGSPNRFLSTIQIGVTLIGILTGAIGGAVVSEWLAVYLKQFEFLASSAEAASFTIVVLTLTYLSLVLGELVPKRLALNYPERIARFVAGPMSKLSRIVSPMVLLLSSSIDFVLRIFGFHHPQTASVTDDEVRMLIAEGAQTGVFEQAEKDMVERVLRLADRSVGAMMTPRRQIEWVNLEDPVDNILQNLVRSVHSRVPVCQGRLNQLLGVVPVKDLYIRLQSRGKDDLKDIFQTPLFVPESQRALGLLELWKKSGTHMAFVIDEYGVIQGVVTLHNLLEAIAGEIPDEGESEEPQIIRREDGSLLLDGMLATDDLKSVLNIAEFPDDENYHTLAGFMMARIGSIPVSGNHFEWEGLHFEVMDMDGKRVDKVLVRRVEVGSRQ